MLKLLWSRRLVWQAHKHNQLHEAQAGSRPDHRCIDVVVQKTMNYTYATLTRTPLITIDNDAKACYDRIPCNLAMLVSRYFGMTSEACSFLSKTLHSMKFKIRTAAGDSEKWYAHSADTPIHGTGQGSCASPCLWLLISSVLMECQNKLAIGMTQHDVIPDSAIRKCVVEGFVDDVSMFINPDYMSSHLLPWLEEIERLISNAESDFETWNMLLGASGGKLEWDKCFWYLLCWYFNRYGDPIPLSLDQIQAIFNRRISVLDKDTNQRIFLQQKDVNEAHRTLGAYKSMVDNEDKQYEVLLEKSNQLAVITRTGQLSRFQARRAFTSIYIPWSMTYSLVSTNLSQSALRAVQSKAIQAFLPAMGYERTFPHAVVFASRQMGGLNIGDLYTECGVAKIGIIIEHIRANTGLGRIVQINLNWLQLHAGISHPVLETDLDVARYIPNNWFIHLKQFLRQSNSTISIQSQWCPTIERERDCLLMDRIAALNLPKRILRTCNHWRLFFRALTLSDITTADGSAIHDRYWKASEAIKLDESDHRQSRLGWPIQTCPDRKTFSAWKHCLNLAFHLRNKQQLPIPLGDWTVESKASSNDWAYYVNPYTSKLYHNRFDGTYTEHEVLLSPGDRVSSTYRFNPEPSEYRLDLPTCTYPVSPKFEYNTLRFKKSQCTCMWAFSSKPSSTSTFEDHLMSLPVWKQQLLMHWETTPSEQIVEFFQTASEIMVASDGGFNLEKGTGSFGAVIADKQHQYASISGSAPGAPELHCSFRSEMYGLLAACSFLNELFNFFRIQIGDRKVQILVFLDSQSTIDRVMKHRHNPISLKDMSSADMDLELQVLQELQELEDKGFQIPYFHHVKSHQDQQFPIKELSRPAQLNIEADRLASEFPKTDFIRQQYHPPTAARATLYIKSSPITSRYKECIRQEVHTPALKEYVTKKWNWELSTFDNLWWKAHGTALKRLSHSDGQKIQKFNYNHLPTNRRLSKFQSHIHSMCPCCQSDEETDNHVIWCISGDRTEAKRIWEQDIFHYLSGEHTPLVVRTAIMLGFHHWVHNKPVPPILQFIPTASAELQRAYQDQTHIGWEHFIRGRLSILWQGLIANHLASRPSETGGKHNNKIKKKKKSDQITTSVEWATRLIVAMWHGVLILWDLRNRELHGDRGHSQSTAEKIRLLQEAAGILETSRNYQEHFDIEWFKKPIEELEKYSVISLKAWVRNARMMSKLHRLEFSKTNINLNPEGRNPLDANSNESTGSNGGDGNSGS